MESDAKMSGTDGDCGAGMGVYYDGDYVPASTFEAGPRPDLLSLKVVTGNQQNAAARALLGKDYVTLVDIIDVRSKGDDEDALGANVNEYFVRGIANTNAAIVMGRGDRLWIGMLVFDARNQVRMRYCTNVPAWKRRAPRTIQAWRDRIDSQLPIDLMR